MCEHVCLKCEWLLFLSVCIFSLSIYFHTSLFTFFVNMFITCYWCCLITHSTRHNHVKLVAVKYSAFKLWELINDIVVFWLYFWLHNVIQLDISTIRQHITCCSLQCSFVFGFWYIFSVPWQYCFKYKWAHGSYILVGSFLSSISTL